MKESLRDSFIEHIVSMKNQPAWWWCVDLPLTSVHSLVRLICLETPELHNFLVAIGWAYIHGNSIRLHADQIKSFVTSEPKCAEFLQVTDFRRKPWLQIGKTSMVSKQRGTHFTVADQLANEDCWMPPKVNVETFRVFDSACDSWFDTTTTTTTTTSHATTNCSLTTASRKSQEARDFVLAGENTLEVETSLNNSSVLSKFRIDPTSRHDVESVLRDLIKLNQHVDESILTFRGYNDTPIHLVQVPSSRNGLQFKKNANRGGKNWIYNVLDVFVETRSSDNNQPFEITFEEMVNEECERGSTRKHAALWLMTHLGRKHGDEFAQAAEQLRMPIRRHKMDAATTAEMWDAAGAGTAAQRIIHDRFKPHFGWRFTATEEDVKVLQENAMSPKFGSCCYNGKNQTCWHEDIDHVVENRITLALKSEPELPVKSVDLAIGGDHGQGSFRSVINPLLRDKEDDVVNRIECGISKIECSKENSELLNRSLAFKLNERLSEMTSHEHDESGNLVEDDAGRMTDEGSATLCRSSTTNELCACCLTEKLRRSANDVLIANLPMRCLVAGDLAHCAMMLGMEGHESSWCHMCFLSKKNWEVENHEKGRFRTLKDIRDIVSDLSPNSSEKGIVMMPLLACVEPRRHVPPLLHILLGIVNQILNQLFLCLEAVLEKLPNDLKELKRLDMEAEDEHVNALEAEKKWGEVQGVDLATMRSDRKEIIERLKDKSGTRIIGVEREKLNNERESSSHSIDEAIKERRKLEKATEETRANWLKAKKKHTEQKRVRKCKQPLKDAIEESLRESGIDPASHHGGDLIGNHCRLLLQNSDVIFDEVKAIVAVAWLLFVVNVFFNKMVFCIFVDCGHRLLDER